MVAVLDRLRPGRKPGEQLTASKVRELFDRGYKALAPEQRQYWINAAMISGEQWLTWDDRRRQVDSLPRDPRRIRTTVNRLWPSSRVVMAKLLRRPLVFEVAPTSADDASVAGARLAEAALADLKREHKWEELRRQAAWAVWKGGTAVLAVEWDPAGGTHLGTTEKGRPYGTGDTCEHALSITEVAWEPGVRDAERARWWIKVAALPPSVVKEMYDLPKLPQADASAVLSPLQQKLLRDGRSDAKAELTRVLTYYERPSNEGPGQVGVVVGNEFVDGPHPWPFPFTDRLNMAVIRETPVEGRATGDTVLSAAVPVQVAYNKAHSSITEHMDKAGNARLCATEGTDDDQWTDDPADIVKFLPGADNRPFYLSPPDMPAWWVTQPERLAAAIDDILGVHDVSRGDAPPNVGSGIGLTILAEHDDTPLGALAAEMADGFGRLGSLALEILAAKVTESRTARVDRAGYTPEEAQWTGEALSGQTVATVPLEAVAPRSQAAQMQLAMEMWDRGIISDPKQFALFANLPGAEDFTAGIDHHVSKARRENHELAVGNVAVPAEFDNHATHINEHNRFRTSAKYEGLPDELRDLVDTHVLAHEVMAAEEMGTQLAKAAVSPALAGAAQAGEAPLAGDAAALTALPQAADPGAAAAAAEAPGDPAADPAAI